MHDDLSGSKKLGDRFNQTHYQSSSHNPSKDSSPIHSTRMQSQHATRLKKSEHSTELKKNEYTNRKNQEGIIRKINMDDEF